MSACAHCDQKVAVADKGLQQCVQTFTLAVSELKPLLYKSLCMCYSLIHLLFAATLT